MSSISHPILRAPHSRDQHGLVLSVWKKGEETEVSQSEGGTSHRWNTWGILGAGTAPPPPRARNGKDQVGTFRLQASSHLKRQNNYASVSSGRYEKKAVRVDARGSGSRGRGLRRERGLRKGRGVKAALTAQHVIVGVIRHRVYVGRGLRAALSLVSCYHGGCIDREPFVGVDGDTEEARVCLGRESIDGLLEAKFPSSSFSPRKTMIFAKIPQKELPKVRRHTSVAVLAPP